MKFVDYKCLCGHTTEKSFKDRETFPLEIKCEDCGGAAKKKIGNIALHGINGYTGGKK